MNREKSVKMAIWQNIVILLFWHFFLCASISKILFFQMTSYWISWKTYYSLFLKKYLWPCPGPSMYLSERINGIISTFPHRISKILFVLGTAIIIQKVPIKCWLGSLNFAFCALDRHTNANLIGPSQQFIGPSYITRAVLQKNMYTLDHVWTQQRAARRQF